jgi:hypothetical protein
MRDRGATLTEGDVVEDEDEFNKGKDDRTVLLLLLLLESVE